MKVVILAGGRGMRAYPFTEYLPKPMMPVHGKPMLVRIMQFFAAQGFRDFVLSVGHRKEVILDYFADRSTGWNVRIEDTGTDCDTGGRIARLRHMLEGDGPFIATYGDGLCDLSLAELLAFHRGHGRLATVTTVPLVSQYGTIEAGEDGRVTSFREKPRLAGHWINAGFLVMEPGVFGRWRGESLEREVLPALAQEGELFAFRHSGFFRSMDTQKDQQELDEMFARGSVPERCVPGTDRPLALAEA